MSRTGIAVAVVAAFVGACSSGSSGQEAGTDAGTDAVCSASAGCMPGEVCCEGSRGTRACFTTCVASYQLCNSSAECPSSKPVCVPLGGVFGSVCKEPLDAGTGDATDGAE